MRISTPQTQGRSVLGTLLCGLVIPVLCVFLGESPVAAQTPSSGPADSASADRPLEPRDPVQQRARELFRRGNELRKAGDLRGALDLYLQSRDLKPSVSATLNAALLLDELGRFDEALDLYQSLLVDFAERITADEKQAIAASLAELRSKVGQIEVAANVAGIVVVDGRKRGTLPQSRAISVLPGKHKVRVLKEGYLPAETEVEVLVGKSTSIDLKLEVLASAGRLAVDDLSGGQGLEVLVDGAPVGTTPWEGTLKPGRHLVWLRGNQSGTAPQEAVVLVGQLIQVPMRSEPVGPEIVLLVEPQTAQLALGNLLLGRGSWRGVLPLRKYVLRAVEEGYESASVAVDGRRGGEVLVRLRVDPQHPRWRREERPKLRVELVGGLGVAGSFGGDAEAVCPSSCQESKTPVGYLGELRGAYVLPFGLQFELGGGYMHLRNGLRRTMAGDLNSKYVVEDDIRISGPYASLGIRYGRVFARPLRWTAGLALGAFFNSSRDLAVAKVERGADSAEVAIQNNGGVRRAVDFFAMPELGVEAQFGHLHIGLGLGLGFFLLDGPKLPNGEAAVVRPAGAPACTQGTNYLWCLGGRDDLVGGEKAYSRFLFWSPRVNAGWTF